MQFYEIFSVFFLLSLPLLSLAYLQFRKQRRVTSLKFHLRFRTKFTFSLNSRLSLSWVAMLACFRCLAKEEVNDISAFKDRWKIRKFSTAIEACSKTWYNISLLSRASYWETRRRRVSIWIFDFNSERLLDWVFLSFHRADSLTADSPSSMTKHSCAYFYTIRFQWLDVFFNHRDNNFR